MSLPAFEILRCISQNKTPQHLGGFLPILKGRKTSKIKPEFVIFDPLRGEQRENISLFQRFFLLFQCIVVFLFKTFWGRLECCSISEPVSKPQRDYENLIHLSRIKEGMQGERNSSVFYIYYIYMSWFIFIIGYYA